MFEVPEALRGSPISNVSDFPTFSGVPQIPNSPTFAEVPKILRSAPFMPEAPQDPRLPDGSRYDVCACGMRIKFIIYRIHIV